MPFLSPNQQCQSTEGKNITFHGLAYPKLIWESYQLCLWPLIAPGYLGGGLPCLSSALWCQYPSLSYHYDGYFLRLPGTSGGLSHMQQICPADCTLFAVTFVENEINDINLSACSNSQLWNYWKCTIVVRNKCCLNSTTSEQLKGSVKELNILIYFFFPPITQSCFVSDVLFTGGRGVSDFSVLKYY